MPDRAEMMSALYGVWRLARLDAGGVRYFNLTVEGFWRSFLVVPVLLPLQLFLAWLVGAPEMWADGGLQAWLAVRAGIYLSYWLVFVASMAPLSALLRLSHNYSTYVIAQNWAMTLQLAVQLPVALLSLLLPDQLGAVLMLVLFLVIVAYEFVIARLALGADTLTAAGIVVYAVVLSFVFEGAAEALLG